MIIKGLIFIGSIITVLMLTGLPTGELDSTQQILLYFASAVILGLATAVATLFRVLVKLLKTYKSDFEDIKVLLKERNGGN